MALGGSDVTNSTNRMMKHILSDDVACGFSFRGKRNQKRAFSELNLKTAVISKFLSRFYILQIMYLHACFLWFSGAIKSSNKVTEKEIEDIIKVWLKHAPQRRARKSVE